MAKEATKLDYLRYDLWDLLIGEKKYHVQPIIRITLIIHLGIFLFLGAYSYILALFLRSRKIKLEASLLFFIFGMWYFLLTLHSFSDVVFALVVPHTWSLDSVITSVAILWLYLVPAAPLGVLIMFGWDKLKDIFRPNTLEVQQERREISKQKEDQIRRTRVGQEAERGHDNAHGYITLGPVIRGDIFPRELGIETYQNRLRFQDELLNKHMFVLGTTGAGKTETLLRIIAEILNNTNRRIYFVDGKGDTKLAGKIATLIYNIKGVQVPIFKLGHNYDGAVYNGFCGSTSAIYNRLAEMSAVNKGITSGERYFADIRKRLLQLVCGLGHPELDIEPPRSFDELLDRIDYGVLAKIYQNTPRAKRYVEIAKEENIIMGLLTQMANLSASFGHIINGDGFKLEDTPYALFSLKTPSAGVDAESFLDFFVTDIKDGIANRFTEPTALIIDEFGTFKNQNITEVLSLARGSQTSCILATQDIASLGDEQTRKKILANSNTHVLMKTNYPEDLASLAGTVMRLEASQQILEGEHTGLGSARLQHQFKIDPNEVGKMLAGEAFFINSRYTAKLRVARVQDVPFRPEAIAPIVKKVEVQKPVQKQSPVEKPESTQNMTLIDSIKITPKDDDDIVL